MAGVLKFLFFTCVAVVVGVVIGTVPIGGQTMAERIAAAYNKPATAAPTSVASTKAPAAPKAVARPAAKAKTAVAPAPAKAPASKAGAVNASAPRGPITAGAANTPDGHTESDKAAFDQIIAAKVK